MILALLAAGATIAGGALCASRAAPPAGGRLSSPATKGVELYSWTVRDGSFRYALHWGTNREKTEDEIKAASCVLADLEAVKVALARLAPGEQVIWAAGRKRGTFTLPPADVIRAVRSQARANGMTLLVPRQPVASTGDEGKRVVKEDNWDDHPETRRNVRWQAMDDPEVVGRAEIDGKVWLVRLNDFPDEPLYTLLIDGLETIHFNDWPPFWERPAGR